MPHHTRKQPNPIDLVRASEKFLKWEPTPKLNIRVALEQSNAMMDEKHYTPSELAVLWGVSVQTVRELFKNEDGVLKIGSDGNRNRRSYKTLRIPYSVAERVHTKLSC